MADPLSIAASVVAVVTAAIQSAKSLNDTVKRYKNRDKTLQRLQDELEDLSNMLKTLEEATAIQASVLPLLKGPVSRCSQVCRDFEKSMEIFHGKSKTGLRDWTKMEFMRGSINDFIDALTGYKLTISVGLGTITMLTSKLSPQVLEDFGELIKDTTYGLHVHLQRIEEKIALPSGEMVKDSEAGIDLKDEISVTKECIRICEDASSYLESLTTREPTVQHQTSSDSAAFVQNQFEAQLLTRKALDSNRASFIEILGNLQRRLSKLTMEGSPSTDQERSRFQEDIVNVKQCLEVCTMASKEVSHQKIYTVGEAIADGDSDQVVVNTMADLFNVKKALAKDRSAQLIASTTDESFQQVSHDRYNSRFGAVPVGKSGTDPVYSPVNSETVNQFSLRQEGKESGEAADARQRKPFPNEVRKRMTEEDSGKKPRDANQ